MMQAMILWLHLIFWSTSLITKQLYLKCLGSYLPAGLQYLLCLKKIFHLRLLKMILLLLLWIDRSCMDSVTICGYSAVTFVQHFKR